MKKYFYEVMFKDLTIAKLAKDGLIYIFDREDIYNHLMQHAYLADDALNFYFNESKDRFCAEYNEIDKTYSVNPMMVSEIFGEPILIGEEV